MRRLAFHLLCLLALCASHASLAGSREVSLPAADGLVLKGTWHEPDKPGERAVLLLHAMHSSRGSWSPVLPTLLAAGLRVLAVDLRGYGETGGTMEFQSELRDAGAWLAWIRKQPGVSADRVGIVGASLGGNVGITLCAADPKCATVVALSPSGNFDAAALDFSGRGLMVFAAASDGASARALRAMAAGAQGELAFRMVEGSAHGVPVLFSEDRPRAGELGVWLDQHL